MGKSVRTVFKRLEKIFAVGIAIRSHMLGDGRACTA